MACDLVRAKEVYRAYADAAFVTTPFEYLSDGTQAAWLAVVEIFDYVPDFGADDPDDVPECRKCGAIMACPVCDLEEFAVPAATAGKATAEIVSTPPVGK